MYKEREREREREIHIYFHKSGILVRRLAVSRLCGGTERSARRAASTASTGAWPASGAGVYVHVLILRAIVRAISMIVS